MASLRSQPKKPTYEAKEDGADNDESTTGSDKWKSWGMFDGKY